MNKRIRELAEQAEWRFADKATDEFSEYDNRLKKFAELLVGECAATVANFYQQDRFDCRSARTEILDHFGIEQ